MSTSAFHHTQLAVADDDPHKMVIKTHPPTGYPQVYFLDPDRYLLEFNAEVLD